MKTKLFPCGAFFILMLLPVLSLSAMDVGLLLEGNTAYSNDEDLFLSGAVLPWFSSPLGVMGDMYISAGLKTEYQKETTILIPELLRTELAFRWNSGELKAGRIYYSDPLGFIARGFFDGARFSLDLGGGSLSAGAWYTGFLYKKTANIAMTEPDLDIYNRKFELDNFMDTYFAPSRFLAALDWEHPAIAELLRLKVSLIGQMDLSGNDSLYHSQYLAFKLGIPVNRFTFDVGGCIGLAENADTYDLSFAGELGLAWTPPAAFPNRLMLSGRFSSGRIMDGAVMPFVPVTTEPQGGILKAKLSGLSMVVLDYTARFHQSFSVGLQDSYFILSDLGTYQGQPGGREGHFLGNEFFGFFIWSPVSDLQIKAGGGVFLPSLGNADPNGDMLWRAELGMTLALF